MPELKGFDVRFGDRSDEELIQLAQAGWAPAFAVLVHRYAPVVRATRPRAEPPVPFLTHVFLLAMRELRGRDPRAAVAPWLLSLAGAGARSTKAPVPLSPEELDAIWTRLHGYWPDGHRHVRNVPWRRTAAVVGLAALAGLVPAVVLGIDGADTEEEIVELRAIPLPDERTAEVAEVADEDDEPDFSFPTTAEEQDVPPAEPTQPPPDATETTEPEPEPEDPAGEDDEFDTEGEDTAPDDGTDDDEDSGGLLDGVLGPGDDGDDQQDGDEDDQQDGDEGAIEEHPEEPSASDDAAAGGSEGS